MHFSVGVHQPCACSGHVQGGLQLIKPPGREPPLPGVPAHCSPVTHPIFTQLRRTLRQVVELQRDVQALKAAKGGASGAGDAAGAVASENEFLMQVRGCVYVCVLACGTAAGKS